MSKGPLDDITVLDFSQIRAGPWATQILAEMGAEVIKVERPGTGALERTSGPKQNGFSAEHLARNRNKESVAINLKSERGRDIARELAAGADIVVENFSPGTMEGLGLGYADLTDENPELIYASIKGYGEKGPLKDKKGVDLVMQAEAGIMSVTGPEDGSPVKVGQAIGDIGAGLYVTIGILSALHERERTGEGQHVSSNLFGTIISFLEEYLTMYGMTGEDPSPYGRRHQTTVPYEVVETKDGYIAFWPTGDDGWELFVTEVLEADHLLEYDTSEIRQEHYEEIADEMHPVLKEKTTAEWEEIFDEYDWPNGPLNQVSDVVDHPQAQAGDYVIRYEHEHAGEVVMHGHPLHLSNSEPDIDHGAPKLGEHTKDVVEGHLDLSDDELDELIEDGVLEWRSE